MFVKLPDFKMYYEEFGTGALAVILLHGFPFDHTIWKPVMDDLPKDVGFILPDLRGLGRSTAPAGVYGMAIQAGDIAGLMDALHIEKAALVGHSMGGYISLEFAKLYPRRLLGLAMIASQAAADSAERKAGRAGQIAKVRQEGTASISAAMTASLTEKPSAARKVRRLIEKTSVEGFAGAMSGIAEREEMTPFLPQIHAPALVAAGGKDKLIPRERSLEMARLLPHASLAELPKAGHMLMMEEPRKLAEAIDEWIAKMRY